MRSKIQLESGDTIVFIGDSITDAERGARAYKPFGNGYVHFAAYQLLAKYPQLGLNIINTGVNGDTVRDLEARWETDCIAHRPDVLSAMIGVNDLWRQHAEPERLIQAVYPDEYEVTYRRLLLRARKETNCQFVLMEPFMFCSDRQNAMLKALPTYITIVHKLAEEFDAVLVPLQKFVEEQIAEVTDEKWSADFVHPYIWANAWIAQHWLEVTSL